MKLLIVESPGKLKTLRKILGSGWILEASVGHTTELAHDGEKNLGFEIAGGQVITRYVPRGSRGQQVLAKLRAAVKKADQVYLAMDSDREGEAIAWHLVEQLRLKKFSRVAYTQITDSAVQAAIRSPRPLDFPLIHAQRARQCLDKLVGFEVSPLLWKTTGGKSAGRVQSATLHLICERERERLAFQPKDYWTLHAHYGNGLVAQYEPPKKTVEPNRVDSKEEAEAIQKIARAYPHHVESIEEHEEKRLPLPPLITSSLQQTAGVRLKFPPQKTMKIAQELYEGVGGNGLITYMRTDAVTLSPEFIRETRDWLSQNAPEALAERPPTFRTKADSQGAHEAIRPTSVALTPDKARSLLNRDQLAIYQLIWDRAVASQCRPARLAKTRIDIQADKTKWVSRGLKILEQGYLRFWHNLEDETQLPPLTKGQRLDLKEIKVEKKTTQPPSRFSEAKLVHLMEKLGIGRPSTYASTILTLKDRDYVFLEKDVLAPTALGTSTDEVLTQAMPDLVDVRFTAKMEESLDRIAENKLGWEKFLNEWNDSYFRAALFKAKTAISGAVLRWAPVAPKRRAGRKASSKTAGPGLARKKKKSRKRKAVTKLDSSAAPPCQQGHGPLTARVSKKGAPYWKCAEIGCQSWAWPKD